MRLQEDPRLPARRDRPAAFKEKTAEGVAGVSRASGQRRGATGLRRRRGRTPSCRLGALVTTWRKSLGTEGARRDHASLFFLDCGFAGNMRDVSGS